MDDKAASAAETLTITQTRDMSQAEAMMLTKTVNRAALAGFKRDPWYYPIMLPHCVALGVLVALAVVLGEAYRCCDPKLFWFAIIAVPVYFISALLFRHRFLGTLATANKALWLQGTRHAIDGAGYSVGRDGQRSSLPWQSIVGIERKAGLLLLRNSPVHVWAIAPEACEGQDSEAFCAELERRWQEQRMHDQTVGDRQG